VSSTFPLTSAVQSGDESAVSAILAGGANVNETTSGGQTPLILAVIFGHTNIVEQLVQAGADPEQRDNLGLNAMDWAKRRGLTEALDILTNNKRPSSPPKRIVVNFEEPERPPAPPEPENRESVSEAEKSRRWISGFKQRLDEQALRRMNRNEPSEVKSVKAPEPEPEPKPEPPKPEPEPEPIRVEPKPAPPAHSSRILTPAPTASTTGNRKRCPKCNAIYNGDLVSYCAIDMARLVDADAPIISEPPKSNPPLFWIMVIITLTGSIVVGSLITTYLYKTNQAKARVAAEQQQATIVKGWPEVGAELAGKAVSLPEAECPVKSSDPVTGTVTVRIMVDKNGQVYWARGSGGDWLMRGAATEAAMKSTFAADKLRGRETEGTITYTFKP
jgi:ankyrin repeat protein